MSERGKYIVIEGTDGTGKSTQVKLLRETLAAHGVDSIEFHEPEDEALPITSSIRSIIKDGSQERLGMTNVLLFTAARHEIWHRRAKQALTMGQWVIGSRSYLSTLAYQGYAEGESIEKLERITRETIGDEYMNPDGEIILSIESVATRKERIAARGDVETPDTFEMRDDDFQQRIVDGYSKIADDYDITILDASGSPEQVRERIIAELRNQIPDFPA